MLQVLGGCFGGGWLLDSMLVHRVLQWAHSSRRQSMLRSQAVHAGLLAGRRLIWDEAARRIGVLLSSPAAFEGEHFLQARLLLLWRLA